MGSVLSLADGGHHGHVAAVGEHVRLCVPHPDRHLRADRGGGHARGLAGGYGAGGKPHRGGGVVADEAHAGDGDSARVIYCVLCLRKTSKKGGRKRVVVVCGRGMRRNSRLIE